MRQAQEIPQYTTRQVADVIGRSYITVKRTAKREGIGTMVGPRLRMFSDNDVRRMRDACPSKAWRKGLTAAAVVLLLLGVTAVRARAQDGSPTPDATWDYWATVESTDLTEVAATEYADLYEMDATSTAMAQFWQTVIAAETQTAEAATTDALSAAQSTPVISGPVDNLTPTPVVRALPNTGSGSGKSDALLVLGFAVLLFALPLWVWRLLTHA